MQQVNNSFIHTHIRDKLVVLRVYSKICVVSTVTKALSQKQRCLYQWLH